MRRAADLGWRAWLGILSSALFAAYFLHFVFRTLSAEGLSELLRAESIVALVVASAIYIIIIPSSGIAWSWLLSDMGVTWPWGKSAAVIGTTQIAKYVPGNVAQHLGRAALALPQRMPVDVFGGSLLLETLLTSVSALLIGIMGWSWMRGTAGGDIVSSLFLTGIILLVAVPACVLAFRLLIGLRRRMRWVAKWISADLRFPRLATLLRVVLAYCLNFFVLGLALLVVCRVLGPSGRPDYLLLTGAFALAWLAGYLAPGLPAGMGAREGVLSALLADQFPGSELLNILLGMRLATVLGDVLSFALGLWLARRYLRK